MHPAAEPERHTIDSENAAHALHLLRAHPADRDGRAPVLLLHGSTLPGSIAYTLRFDGRSWIHDLAPCGSDVRSEARRVGKEGGSTGRSRWSPYHYKTHKML